MRTHTPDRRTFTRRAATVAAIGAVTLLATAGPASAGTGAEPPPSGPSPQQATPTERAAAEVRPAIVYLTETFTGYVADETGTFFNDGNPYELSATCTGFGVNPAGYIATAGHCVDTTSPEGIRADFVRAVAADVIEFLPGATMEELVAFGLANWTVEGAAADSPIDSSISVISGSMADAQALPARVVDFRPFSQGDVALLKVEATDLPSVELAGDADVQIGTPLLSVGYPASADAVTDPTLEPSNKDGQVSSRKTVGTVPVYETSAALTPGMSGGPTVDLEGRVLGVNSFMPAQETQAFNFIAPSSGLAELLSRNGVTNELGPDDRSYREALDLYYGGRYSEALSAFDKLLQVAPDHAQAQEYRTLAAKARDRFGDAPATAAPATQPASGTILGLTPVLFWSLVGGGGVVVLAVVALLLVRRGRGGTPPVPQQRRGTVPGGPYGGGFPSGAGAYPHGPGGYANGAVSAPSWPETPATVHGPWTPEPVPGMRAEGGSDAAPTAVVTRPGPGCFRCGAVMAAEARFCGSCGSERY